MNRDEMNVPNKSVLTFLVLAALLSAPSALAAEAAGKIGYMSGTLVAKRADGSIKVMAPKSEVMAGDLLETSKDSFAQVLMKDGSKMTLRPQSNLKIEAFKFSKEAPEDDNAAYRLLKGGFRTVSGLIGKRGNPDAYQLKTKEATIGIRGTDFTTRLCVNDCGDDGVKQAVPATPAAANAAAAAPATPSAAPAPGAEPGVYVTVHDGQVIMAQDNGKKIDIGRGQTGFVNDKVITQLPATPKFMTSDKQVEGKESVAPGSKPGASNTASSQSGCMVK